MVNAWPVCRPAPAMGPLPGLCPALLCVSAARPGRVPMHVSTCTADFSVRSFAALGVFYVGSSVCR